MTLAERDFDDAADRALRALASALDDVNGLDADLESGILTIEIDDGTKYVINSHRAARQIWMAADRSAWHFDPTDDRWVAPKSGDELWSTVESVLSRKLGRAVSLPRS